MEERKEPKLVHRVIPCPQYDVSGMECWIAKRLVTEYLRKGKQEKKYEPLELEMEELDEAVAYTTSLHFPCVILRNENKILYARFYTTGGESVKLTLEEWAGFLAESLY